MDKRLECIKKLKTKDTSSLTMVIGFDGFKDEIIHAIDKRIDADHYVRIDTIGQFAQRIAKASGLSTNVELLPVQQKIGGNGPIMCNALSKHTDRITYIGALGYPTIDDVFQEMTDRIKSVYSIADNGHTDALEFDDGKLLLGKMESLKNVTYDMLLGTVGKERLIEILGHTDLLATVNWSMLPNMSDLWRKIILEILPMMPIPRVKPIFFIDLADPEKRQTEEIREALELLKAFKSHYRVFLGLNQKEAYDIAINLNLGSVNATLKDINTALYHYIDIDGVVVHPVDRSSVCMNDKYYEALGPYFKKPKLTTGAGDNFNSGFVLGLLLGLEPEEALLTGMSTSGFYVSNAKSPTLDELIRFMDDWVNKRIG
jgi:sugar/nucleoside kinase (ribokinase family)